MLQRILVGLDGSKYSCSATELGLRLANEFQATLVGLGVVDEQTIRAPEAVPLGAGHYKADRDESLLADAHRKVEKFLDKFSQRCQQANINFDTRKCLGLPAKEIIVQAQCHDLILLGQETYFYFHSHERACQTLTTVLRSSPRPIVAVPESLPQGKTIAVAFDGSLPATRSMQLFQSLQLAGDRLVHVISVDPDYSQAQQWADRATEYFQGHNIQASSVPVASCSSPAGAILEQVRQLDAGMLVIGAFGKSVLREFLQGSNTLRLLNDCPAPVFVYH